MATNIDKLASNAEEFNKQLHFLAVSINADLSQIVRATVLRLFGKIIQISPVDTGAYRASHQIRNHEPAEGEGVIKSAYKQGENKAAAKSWATEKANGSVRGWTWHPGDGSVWIFNNVPYAYRLEEGHSDQAKVGIYNVALAQMTQILNQEIAKSKYWQGTS